MAKAKEAKKGKVKVSAEEKTEIDTEKARLEKEDAKLAKLFKAVGWVRALTVFGDVFPEVDVEVSGPSKVQALMDFDSSHPGEYVAAQNLKSLKRRKLLK